MRAMFPDIKIRKHRLSKQNSTIYTQIANIEEKLALDSVKFSKKKATVKEEITITAVTSTNATKLTAARKSRAGIKGNTDKRREADLEGHIRFLQSG